MSALVKGVATHRVEIQVRRHGVRQTSVKDRVQSRRARRSPRRKLGEIVGGAMGETRGAVTVAAEMTAEQRRAAVAGLASGVRTVEMPASWELLHGEAVHSDDVYPLTGTVIFEARAGHVYARRKAAEARVNIMGGAPGVRRFEVEFSGDVDPDHRVVRGTVSSELKRMNRSVYPLAVFAGVLIGWGLAVAAGRLWSMVLFVPLAVALLLAVRLVTSRREARVMVADLQRIAALAAGQRPKRGMSQSTAEEH